MITLRNSSEILRNTYLYLVNDCTKHPKKYPTKVGCCKCGKTNTTLRKMLDGNRICNDCYKKEN